MFISGAGNMTTQSADIIVVGGGLAGFSAAITAAEAGLKTILIEQGVEERYLCNSRICIGVLQVALLDMRSSTETLAKAIDDSTRRYVDPALRDKFASEAAPSFRWLATQGIRTINAGTQTHNLVTLAPPVPRQPGLHWQGRAGDVMLGQLVAKLKALGGTLTRGMQARELIMADGHCAGVTAVSGNETHRFESRAVVLADGGFQANTDLLKRFISKHPERLLQRNAKSGRGSGLMMAKAVGAKLTDMECFYGHIQSRDAMDNPELWPYPTMDFPVGAGIAVDQSGKRFADEGLGGVAMANAIARLDDPSGAVAIFDQNIWELSGKTYVMSANPFVKVAGGTIYKADTIEALAQAAGLPVDATASTVAGYNRALTDKTLPQQTPRRTDDYVHAWGSAPVPIVKAPFYAVPLCAGITYTMGGLKVDPQARVQHQNGGPIEGLYAAGGTIGGLEGGPYTGYTGGLAKALVWGRIAGGDAARLVKGS